jgi:hypothetical protein
VACGVEEAEVRARTDAEEAVAAVAAELGAVASDYATAINVELELMPWSESDEIRRKAKEVVHVFAQFMIVAEEARALLDTTRVVEEASR